MSAPVCRLESWTEGEVGTLRLVGELDLYTSSDLREGLRALVGQGATLVVVDLADVTFADSTAMAVLVAAVKLLRAVGGELVLKDPQPAVTKVLKLTGLDTIFTIV